jgi:signal transduction histidine kinase
LPIARELAVALGGRVELETELGRGSRFRLVLPLERRW